MQESLQPLLVSHSFFLTQVIYNVMSKAFDCEMAKYSDISL